MVVNLQSINNTAVAKTSVTGIISVSLKQRKDKFALLFNGYIKIDKDGFYTFFSHSDDGSRLLIDDAEMVNTDENPGSAEKGGKAALKKGYHKITLQYYDSGGDNFLRLLMQPDGGSKMELPATMLFHAK